MEKDRNRHGHLAFRVELVPRRGMDEIARIIEKGGTLLPHARRCLASMEPDGYDKAHQPPHTQTVGVALLFFDCRKSQNLRQEFPQMLGYAEMFGYKRPLACIVPRIHEKLTIPLRRTHNASCVGALHKPIQLGGVDHILATTVHGSQLELMAVSESYGGGMHSLRALAFIDPEL